MKADGKQILFILGLIIMFFISGCSSSSSSDDSVVTSDDSDVIEEERPVGWTDETHGDDAQPNYDMVFSQDTVRRIDLTIESADWQMMQDDMTENYGEFGSGGMGGGPPDGGGPPPGGGFSGVGMGEADANPIWRPCTFEFEGITWWHAGVRFKGNSSLRDTWGMGIYKLPLRFDFDEFEDDYPEIDDQRFYGFKKLTLSSNYHDDSFIREKLAADIFRDAGVPAPQTAFYRVYIDMGNGPVYFGLYTMVEVPAEPMLEQQFLDPEGNLYKPEGTGATFAGYDENSFDKETNEDEADYSDVLALYNTLQSSRVDAEAWRSSLEKVLDVTGFLRWLAVNTVIENWDTYGLMSHNYYLYNDPGDGLLHWIPWDNNESLGVNTRDPLSLDLSSSEVGSDWPLIRYLMDDALYRQTYVELVEETVTEVFNVDRMEPIFEAAHELVGSYVVGDGGEIEGYTLLTDSDNFDAALDALNDHVADRYDEALEFVDEN